MLIEILKNQVVPALGCTEPGAVAYAVARAKEILKGEVIKLNIYADKNIIKNGMSVGIPGTDEHGIIFAAALSLVIGNSDYKLEVLKNVNNNSIDEALDIVNSGIITLSLNDNIEGLYIKIEAFGQDNSSCVLIRNSHTNIIFESKNNEIILDKPESILSSSEIKYEIKNYSIEELISFTNTVNISDIEFIQNGIDLNLRIADAGLKNKIGVGLGSYFYQNANNPFSIAKAYTTAASEARMSGYLLPVMSSAGSGNHGLVAIIPIASIGQQKNIPKDKLIRAVTLSHLVTIFVKVHIGSLSPVCGCGVAAGVGCAAGLTYLLGGNIEQIKGSINNMIAGISGMLCDGAKLGCSYKLSISVDAAVDAAEMALMNIFIPADNGILGDSPEKTILNLAHVSNKGMKNTDDVILEVMLNKC